jgi:hypothetical protein
VHFYAASGLSMASEIALPGMIAAAPAPAPDVTIRRAPVPPSLDDAASTGATWQRAGERFLLGVPGIARFLLTGGRDIAVEPEPQADAADIAVFIAGTAFGILLHQREQIVLHASAVRVNGKAVLFCGQSGAGKSTLAAALSQRGYPVLADDICALTLAADGRAVVHSDGGLLQLWARTVASLGLTARRGARLRAGLEKYYVEPPVVSHGALPLGALYALREARPPHKAGISRPNIVDAALLLRRGAYRPLLVRSLNQTTLYFHAAAIANHAGIYQLTRPLNFAAMADTLGGLEQHWRDIGMLEQAA